MEASCRIDSKHFLVEVILHEIFSALSFFSTNGYTLLRLYAMLGGMLF